MKQKQGGRAQHIMKQAKEVKKEVITEEVLEPSLDKEIQIKRKKVVDPGFDETIKRLTPEKIEKTINAVLNLRNKIQASQPNITVNIFAVVAFHNLIISYPDYIVKSILIIRHTGWEDCS